MVEWSFSGRTRDLRYLWIVQMLHKKAGVVFDKEGIQGEIIDRERL